MMLEEKLSELSAARQAKAAAQAADDAANERARFDFMAASLKGAIQSVAVLADLGFTMAGAHGQLEDRAQKPILRASATVAGVGLRCVLSYKCDHTFVTPRPGDRLRIALAWDEDPSYARHDEAVYATDAIERAVIGAVDGLLKDVAARRAKIVEMAALKAAKVALLPQFLAHVAAYQSEWATYAGAHGEWLKSESARLWAPWVAYQIWPLAPRPTLQEDDEAGADYPTLLVLEDPSYLAATLRSTPTVAVTVIGDDGRLSHEGITGFWRFKEVRFDMPARPYHRLCRFGDYYDDDVIFASPLIDGAPAAPPARPPFWADYVEKFIPAKGDGSAAYASLYRFFARASAYECAALTGADL